MAISLFLRHLSFCYILCVWLLVASSRNGHKQAIALLFCTKLDLLRVNWFMLTSFHLCT